MNIFAYFHRSTTTQDASLNLSLILFIFIYIYVNVYTMQETKNTKKSATSTIKLP